MFIEPKSLVLFQGDSTTDCGRNYADGDDLGPGYPVKVATYFSTFLPELEVRFLNRGMGGHRVRDLAARWQRDCVDLKPDYLSIMIGINDCWRRFDCNDPTTVEDFENTYRDILRQAADTGAKLIMMEPFVLPIPSDRLGWREDLDPKIQAVRRLAREFDALLIPLDGVFGSAIVKNPPEFYVAAQDGVHPTDAGHALIAKTWLRAVGAL